MSCVAIPGKSFNIPSLSYFGFNLHAFPCCFDICLFLDIALCTRSSSIVSSSSITRINVAQNRPFIKSNGCLYGSGGVCVYVCVYLCGRWGGGDEDSCSIFCQCTAIV